MHGSYCGVITVYKDFPSLWVSLGKFVADSVDCGFNLFAADEFSYPGNTSICERIDAPLRTAALSVVKVKKLVFEQLPRPVLRQFNQLVLRGNKSGNFLRVRAIHFIDKSDDSSLGTRQH